MIQFLLTHDNNNKSWRQIFELCALFVDSCNVLVKVKRNDRHRDEYHEKRHPQETCGSGQFKGLSQLGAQINFASTLILPSASFWTI